MKWKVCSVIVGLALLLIPQQGHALSLGVGSAAFDVGNTFSVGVFVTDAVDLTSWQFDLRYDPTILQANFVTEGPFLSSAGATLFVPGVIDNTTGLISLVAGSFVDLTPPSGSGVLARVEFTTLSLGVSALELDNAFLNFGDSGFTTTTGLVTVRTAGVPEPNTAVLLSLGGLLFWAVQRWNRTRCAII
ncbi:cohesin domain-containing protein [Nitrospira sp. NS4]|uniref:cohesin domain-containing protein n=1 Tax=Nitrospira sp. NS4 TaxID=3414498 RepID=UPI003C3017DA